MFRKHKVINQETISYSILADQITNSEKFKIAYFDILNSSVMVTQLWEQIARSKIAIDQFSGKLPNIKEVLKNLDRVIKEIKYGNQSVLYFYEQVYIHLLSLKNYTIVEKELDDALSSNVITIDQHYQVTRLFRKLEDMKQMVMSYASKESEFCRDYQSRSHCSEPAWIKSVKKIVDDSDIISHINDVLTNASLIAHAKPDEKNMLLALMQDLSEVADDDLQGYVETINGYYTDLPLSMQEKLTTSNLVYELKKFLAWPSQIPQPAMLPASGSAHFNLEKRSAYAYSLDVNNMIKKRIEEMVDEKYYPGKELSSRKSIFLDLLDYIFNDIKNENNSKYLYMLDLLQHVITRNKEAIRSDIAWVNCIYYYTVVSNDYSSRALFYISKVAIQILMELTDSARKELMGKNVLFEFLDQLDCYAEKLNPSVFDDRTTGFDSVRIQLLRDLSDKSAEYMGEIKKAALAYPVVEASDKLMNTFLLRLVAVEFLSEKILSGKALSSKDITQEMIDLFEDAIFEKSWLGRGFISNLVQKMNLPSLDEWRALEQQKKEATQKSFMSIRPLKLFAEYKKNKLAQGEKKEVYKTTFANK